ncbi:hypothetical protein GGR50DRAFT_525979 [Xylaria sp. CBS 124048]|nr:hypothetical protein GGR50DRAFT_525979 [Xylaria sp. CBS 124048]
MHIDFSRPFNHTVQKCRHRHNSNINNNSNSKFLFKSDRVRRILAALNPSPRYLKMQTSSCKQEVLSVFNQIAPRGYICVVLCFPFGDERQRQIAIDHIHKCLRKLAKERPLFAGRLCITSDGKVILHRSRAYDIPFEVKPSEYGQEADYEQLRRDDFPPGYFVNSRYGVPGLEPGNEPIPMSRVEATFARGGLLLSVYLQHAITDGSSLQVFLASLGNQTRNVSSDKLPSEQRLRIPNPNSPRLLSTRRPPTPSPSTFTRLLGACPEYNILPDLSGPTQPVMKATGVPISDLKKICKIFVFTTGKLLELRKLLQDMNDSPELPTSYSCLAALTFAHVTRARTRMEPALTGIEPSKTAELWNSVNWRKRAFVGATDNYFGNAVLPAVTKVSADQVEAACYDDQALARLVPVIKRSVNVVDESYVRQRMVMMSQIPDPRMLGVNYDPRSPDTLAFNTWRHFGADAEWSIPGVPANKPDIIRRAVGGFGLGTALILPAKAASDRQELSVSLTVEAMETLCKDERWMRWVDKVIG